MKWATEPDLYRVTLPGGKYDYALAYSAQTAADKVAHVHFGPGARALRTPGRTAGTKWEVWQGKRLVGILEVELDGHDTAASAG